MVKCLICGLEKLWSIVEHLKYKHGLTCAQYREVYPDAELKSEEARRNISKTQRAFYEDPVHHQELCARRQKSHRTLEFRTKQSHCLKKFYENGGHAWNEGLTKQSDERVARTGNAISVALSGRTKETHEYLARLSILMKSRPNYRTIAREAWSEERKRNWREKISQTLALKCNVGETGSSKRYKTGNFITAGGVVEYFQSSWEEELMFELDKRLACGEIVAWTKKHGIHFKYQIDDITRIYVPDFLVSLFDRQVLVELKGWGNVKEIELKTQAARAEFGDRYVVCYSVDDVRRYLDEAVKDQRNRT